MTDTPNQDAAVQSIQEILRREYLRGYTDGAASAESLRAEIMATLDRFPSLTTKSSPARALGPPHRLNHISPERAEAVDRKKAPKGAVGAAISEILKDGSGLTLFEIEEWCSIQAPGIAVRSVGNELRRFRGVKYRQEGRNWFLISTPETETAEGALESASAA